MLSFRKISKKDLTKVMKWRMSEEVTKYMYTDPVLDINKQEKWIKKISSDKTVKYWMIMYDNKDIGVLNLYDIDALNSRCFWAYYIGEPTFKGKHIARHLECNIYDYVFYELNFKKLCCDVLSFNQKVIDIHQKFGSKIEGEFKKHIFKNGHFYDVVRMAILKEEWDKQRTNIDYKKVSFK